MLKSLIDPMQDMKKLEREIVLLDSLIILINIMKYLIPIAGIIIGIYLEIGWMIILAATWLIGSITSDVLRITNVSR